MNQETHQCQNCKQDFVIEPDDFAFYEKMKVPPPTFCPECRIARRFAWRNERTLYKRTCDLCKKSIVAMYPESAVFPVYCRECWYSDKWDPLEYGKNLDFSKVFLKQFQELINSVPRIALQIDNSVNCEFSNQIADCKNCYLVVGGAYNEDSLYSLRIFNCKNVTDCLVINKGEQCYQAIESTDISQVLNSLMCYDSLGLTFCYDIRGSQNCFLSSNLRQKSYYFNNKQLSKEEYTNTIESIDLGSYKVYEQYKQKSNLLKLKSIHKFANIRNSPEATGHSIMNSKNVRCLFGAREVENCRYCFFLNNAKDVFDVNNACCVIERCYEVATSGINVSNVKFSSDAWPEVRDTTYSDTCRNGASNPFGCNGIRGKHYCILNKQYTKEEYNELVPKIIQHMNDMPYVDKKGRVYKYGEFFPQELSPFAYNESMAQEYFPLTKEQAIEQGYPWKDQEQRSYNIQITNDKLPDHIKDVDEDIIGKIIECAHKGACNEQCTQAFKIVKEELQFYKKMNLPLPRLCPNCRHFERLKQRNPLKLWYRQCMCDKTNHFHGEEKCKVEFETSYAPDRKEIVYCEQCYQAEVA